MRILAYICALAAAEPDLTPKGPISQKLSQSYADVAKVQDSILAAEKKEEKLIDMLPQFPNDPWGVAPKASSLLEVTPDLTPVGPISSELSKSYSDLDKVQDSILAAQKKEMAEIDQLPQSQNDPWDAPHKASSLLEEMETADDEDIDFGELDSLSSKLTGLEGKTGDDLKSIKKKELKDEDFSQQAAEEAAAAEARIHHVQPTSLIEMTTMIPKHVHGMIHALHVALRPLRLSVEREMKTPGSKHAHDMLDHLVSLEGVVHHAVQRLHAAACEAKEAKSKIQHHAALIAMREGMLSTGHALQKLSHVHDHAILPGSLVEASTANFGDVGYNQIADQLKGLQSKIDGQVTALKSQVAQTSIQQVQQLDSMLDSNPTQTNADAVSKDTYSLDWQPFALNQPRKD